MKTSFNIQEFLEFNEVNVTYLQSCLPTITTGEESVTTYIVHNGETLLEYDSHIIASYMVQQCTITYETIIERYAQHAFLSASQQHQQDLCDLRSEARAAQVKLRAIQDYGIQHRVEKVPTYTVDPVNFRQSEVGHVARIRETFTSRKALTTYLQRLLHDLQKFDKSFQEVFGYGTLEEATRKEQYLSTLLRTHSILDIYLLHYQYFPKMTARDVIYDKFFNRHSNLRGDTKDLLYYQTLQDIQDDYGQSLQRRIMRTIFDRPEILNHIHDIPFDWLISTIDPADLDAENIPIQEKLTFP